MICHKLLANRIGALLLSTLCQTAAQESGKVLDQGGGKVLGLVFRVEDIGGKTQDPESGSRPRKSASSWRRMCCSTSTRLRLAQSAKRAEAGGGHRPG